MTARNVQLVPPSIQAQRRFGSDPVVTQQTSSRIDRMNDAVSKGTRGLFRRVKDHHVLRLAKLLAAAAFLLDWSTKSWALQHLDGTSMPLGALTLGVARNEAFAFSAGDGQVSALLVICVRLAALISIILVCRRVTGLLSKRNACGVALLLAGGFGNAADLLFRGGAVVDFIGAGPFTFDWAGESMQMHVVFNAADLFILVGIGLMAPLIQHVARAVQRRFVAWESRLLKGVTRSAGAAVQTPVSESPPGSLPLL
jgi:lipoprotein signal peptidase